jgi:hypothetical protein
MNGALVWLLPASAHTSRQLRNLVHAAFVCADQLETVAAQWVFGDELCATLEREARDLREAAMEVESLQAYVARAGFMTAEKKQSYRTALPLQNDRSTLHAAPPQDQQCLGEVKGSKRKTENSRQLFRKT